MNYPTFWVAERAPIADAVEGMILIGLATKGDPDGRNCFPSYATLARRARVDPKTVGRKCRALEARGILRRQTGGIHEAWHKIPEAQRPVVWEIMVPAEWYSAQQLEGLNERREREGCEPITPETRPPLPEAPPKKQRSDKGVKRPRTKDDPGTESPHPRDYESPGDPGTESPHPRDYESGAQGLRVPTPGTTSPTTSSVTSSDTPSGTTSPLLPSEEGLFDVPEPEFPTADAAGGDEQQTPEKVTAQTIVGEWLERCPKRPPNRVTGQVAKTVKELLDEGVEPDDVRRGMALWMHSGKTAPSLIPGFVHEVMNAGASPGALEVGGPVVPFGGRRPSTTDQRVQEALEAGRRLQARADAMREQGARL